MADWRLNEGPYPTSNDSVCLLLQQRSSADTWTTRAVIDQSGNVSTAIAKSLLTAMGDLIYASAASTPARLGVGTSGALLKVVAGVPAWQASPLATYGGVGLTTLPSGVETIINYDTSLIDTDAAVTTGASWRFTVPTGKAGPYQVATTLQLNAGFSGQWISSVFKNGARQFYLWLDSNPLTSDLRNGSCVLNCAAGDTIDVRSLNTSAGSVTVGGGSTTDWVSIRMLP